MSGKCRPSLREKTLKNVRLSNLSETDKKCIEDVFALVDQQAAEVESLANITVEDIGKAVREAFAEERERNTVYFDEVVRCKDCKHYHTPDCSLWYGTLGDKEYYREHGTDFYCAYGEREDKGRRGLMKEDEKKFFITCYRCREAGHSIRLIINILGEFINYKRCWYLLGKWSRFGFYNYGVTLDLGWFELDKMPERYLKLICPERSKDIGYTKKDS